MIAEEFSWIGFYSRLAACVDVTLKNLYFLLEINFNMTFFCYINKYLMIEIKFKFMYVWLHLYLLISTSTHNLLMNDNHFLYNFSK